MTSQKNQTPSLYSQLKPKFFRVYTIGKLLVWISSRRSMDHLKMLLLLSCVEIVVVLKVVLGDCNKKKVSNGKYKQLRTCKESNN
jgi:hypothetical protein